MMTSPARRVPILISTLFVTVIVLIVLGALWYKQTSGNTYVPGQMQEGQVSESPNTIPTAQLRLIPTESTATGQRYRLVVDGLTGVVNGVVFEMLDAPGDSELLSSNLETDPALQQAGWSMSVNNQASSETGRTFAFSMVRTLPGEEVQPSIELGTLEFELSTSPLENDIALNEDESVVSYTSGQTATLKLIVETDTMDN